MDPDIGPYARIQRDKIYTSSSTNHYDKTDAPISTFVNDKETVYEGMEVTDFADIVKRQNGVCKQNGVATVAA